MTRRLLLGATLLIASADVARAQIINAPIGRSRPSAWASLHIGWFQQQGIQDVASGATWSFAGAPQWRASLELPVGNGGASFGVVGTTSRVPLLYGGGILTPNSCSGCDADANVTQILGLVHLGGFSGFHQVIDLAAGTTLYSNFRATGSGATLGPGGTVSNFTFMAGYGFGYGFSQNAQIELVQDYAILILKRQSGSSTNTAQQQNLRFGFRYGLGGR